MVKQILLALLLTGCAAGPTSFARFYTGGEPSVLGLVSTQARLLFSIVQEGERQVQAVSGLTYNAATLTLSNANGLLSSDVSKSLSITSPATTSSGVFTALRPGDGYGLSVILKNGASSVGNGGLSGITLTAGQTKSVTIIIAQDGNIKLQTSTVGNALGSTGAWVIAKGDTVTLRTGFGATETGVSKLQVVLDAGLYGAETVIAEKTSGFDAFTWVTGTAAAPYNPVNLTTSGTQNGTVTFKLLDASNKVIGQTQLTGVSVVAGSLIDLVLQ